MDETVLRWVHHDFVTQRLALEERRAEYPDAKLEHDMSFHILDELRPESVQDSEAPEYFVNTLAVLGRAGDATALAGRIDDALRTTLIRRPRSAFSAPTRNARSRISSLLFIGSQTTRTARMPSDKPCSR